MEKSIQLSARVVAFLSILALSLGMNLSAFAQARIMGTVTDAETGESLPGANVVLEGTTTGTSTDTEGHFVLPDVPAGTYTVVASYVGYESESRRVTVGSSDVTVNFALPFFNQALEALEVFASRAIDRKTPVAYSNIDKVQIQRQLGSRDIPLVLNTTPSVYSTAMGGGAGDARINVRGFNQRNVAVMINGVPVNDMENGWVYWSNWDGVGDAATSIQLQRGLSAVNLATPSIGGTLNIITDPAAMGREVSLKQEFGNDGFLKTTVTGSTGLIDGKFALTAAGVRKTGDGLYQGTYVDAWAYYVAASYNINATNRLDFYALGAPQRHGQNLYMQNIAAYDHDFARDVFDDEVLNMDTDGNGTPDVFDDFPEAGREYNENFNTVASSYQGEQAAGDDTFDRYDAGFLNERENFFHKPQVNLNWYSQLNDRLLLSTVVYYSGGHGGGTGTAGDIVWDYSGPSRIADWNATIEANRNSDIGSLGILRNSRNNQWTIGAISKLAVDVTRGLEVEVGLDWRTAEIEHYREVRDLLGGDYFLSTDSDFWPEGGLQLGLGDKFAYNFTNTVDWIGGFVQGEFERGPFSGYGMVGLSSIKYTYTNHFVEDPNNPGQELISKPDPIWGYQAKGGGLYNLNDQLSVFANVGVVSKVPIFDGVVDDVGGVVNQDPVNEEFYSAEGGINFRLADRALNGKINVYSTFWKDRTFTRFVRINENTDGLVNLTGVNALHQGVEAELAYQPIDLVRFDAAAAVGNWRFTEDASGTYRPDDRSTEMTQYFFTIKDLKIGDAPQTQVAYAATLFPINGLFIKAIGKTFADFYADFSPFDRGVEIPTGQTISEDDIDRGQSWKAPSYTLFDVHVGYDLPLRRVPVGVRVFGHVFNVFDTMYVQDAIDNSSFNAFGGDGTNHEADDAEVFLGLPRTFTLGVQVTY